MNTRYFSKIEKILKNNSSTILTVIGISGMGVSIISAVMATPKALDKIKELKNTKNDVTKGDIVKVCWKDYLTPAIIFGASTACLIGSLSINKRCQAALISAASVTEEAYKQYRHAVVEEIGEKKEEKIYDKISEKKISSHSISLKEGETVIRDSMSGRLFNAQIDDIKRKVNELNQSMLIDPFCGNASLNDFYDSIGLERTEAGEILGWNVSNLCDLYFSANLLENNSVVIDMYYKNMPTSNYQI